MKSDRERLKTVITKHQCYLGGSKNQPLIDGNDFDKLIDAILTAGFVRVDDAEMPEKQVETCNHGTGCECGDADRGYNQALDDCKPYIARLQKRIEELEHDNEAKDDALETAAIERKEMQKRIEKLEGALGTAKLRMLVGVAYSTKENSHKEMDVVLGEAIVRAIRASAGLTGQEGGTGG